MPDARAGHRAAPVPDARADLALDTVGAPTYVPTPVASFNRPVGLAELWRADVAAADALHGLQPSPTPSLARYYKYLSEL